MGLVIGVRVESEPKGEVERWMRTRGEELTNMLFLILFSPSLSPSSPPIYNPQPPKLSSKPAQTPT